MPAIAAFSVDADRLLGEMVTSVKVV